MSIVRILKFIWYNYKWISIKIVSLNIYNEFYILLSMKEINIFILNWEDFNESWSNNGWNFFRKRNFA